MLDPDGDVKLRRDDDDKSEQPAASLSWLLTALNVILQRREIKMTITESSLALHVMNQVEGLCVAI